MKIWKRNLNAKKKTKLYVWLSLSGHRLYVHSDRDREIHWGGNLSVAKMFKLNCVTFHLVRTKQKINWMVCFLAMNNKITKCFINQKKKKSGAKRAYEHTHTHKQWKTPIKINYLCVYTVCVPISTTAILKNWCSEKAF